MSLALAETCLLAQLDSDKKFLVVRFAPGSGGKFLSILLQCSNSVHAWDDILTQAKQENNNNKILDYVASKFTTDFTIWQKLEPEVPYQTDFVSNRFPRGDDITFEDANKLLSTDIKYQCDYNNSGFISLILNKSQVPSWLQDRAIFVNILIDTPESKKWFYRSRFAKQFIRINKNSYIIKQDHEDYCSPKRSILASKFNNEKIFHGSWYSFAKKYLIGDAVGRMFTQTETILEHPSNKKVKNLFFNLSCYFNADKFFEEFQNLCNQIGIEQPSKELIMPLIRHYQSIHSPNLNNTIFSGLSYNYKARMNKTKAEVFEKFKHPNYIGTGIGDQVPPQDLDKLLTASNTTVLITDNKITQETKPNQIVLNIAPEFYGIHYMPFDLKNSIKPNRAYNCFINRVCPTRQSWFYKLYDLGLDRGFVSFNLDYRESPSHTYKHKLEIFDRLHHNYNTLFQQQYKSTRNLIPFCNFKQTNNIEDVICESMVSLVIETYFHDNRAIALSEKTFRALQLPRPFLLFAPKNTIKYLKELGFKIIEDIVNHDYDDHDDWVVRQTMILDQLTNFLNNENYNVPQSWLDIAHHNQQLMCKWSIIWDTKLQAALTQANDILYNQ